MSRRRSIPILKKLPILDAIIFGKRLGHDFPLPDGPEESYFKFDVPCNHCGLRLRLSLSSQNYQYIAINEVQFYDIYTTDKRDIAPASLCKRFAALF